MTNGVRLLLTFLAVACAAIAAADPIGMPTWVQVIVAAVATGLAAIGIPTRPTATDPPPPQG